MPTRIAPSRSRHASQDELLRRLDLATPTPRVLELLALAPPDGTHPAVAMFGHEETFTLFSQTLRTVACDHGAESFQLSDGLYAVLSWSGAAGLMVVPAFCQALAAASSDFEDSLAHARLRIPAELAGGGRQLLGAAMDAMRSNAPFRAKAAASQVRAVLLQVMAERRSGEPDERRCDVVSNAVAVGRRLGMPSRELHELARAAELRDIGLLTTPSGAKREPGSPADDLASPAHRHPLVAERILSPAPAMVGIAAVVRSSRERFDGHGYPDALSGERIPLAARVLAVCAAYAAMLSPGPGAPPDGEALRDLARRAGSEFDPAVVRALFQVVEGPRAGQLSVCA